MTTLRLLFLLCSAVPLLGFEWPGGTMNVPVTFRGQEVFAGWVPSSPWGSAAFLRDPVVELRNQNGDVVAEYTVTGGVMDWYDGSSRSGVATFSATGGTYTITTRQGRRLIRIQGEGYSGFALNAESVTEPGPANRAPSIAWTSAPVAVADGQGYTVSVSAHDDDGNLTAVSIWKDGNPFAFAGGGDGTDGTSGNPTSDGGPRTVTFTAQAFDSTGAASAFLTHVVTIAAPVNRPPQIALLSPGNQTVTAGTTLTISSQATDPDGNIANHNLDIQRPAGDWNFQGGFATGEPFQGGPVGSGGDSTRSAGFTFTDVGTYVVRAAVNDGSGWYHSETVSVSVVAPPPVQYALTTSAGAGGAVTAGGTYNAGMVVTVSATPDAMHDFAGWSGDAGGLANPLSISMDRNRSVQANFVVKSFALTTSASGGGAVTPGGTYPYGTVLTLTGTPDATHRFVQWSGDASGTSSPVAVVMDRARVVQAVFASKTAQTIAFAPVAAQPVNAPPLSLSATSSSGLPVTFAVVSGPAALNGSRLTITGAGAITVQASQAGDATYLPAPSVAQTFNAVANATLKYRPASRTILRQRDTEGAAPFVLERP
jgi:hypothetical protein